MIGSSALRRIFWLRRVLPLLLVGLLFMPVLLVNGCGGGKKSDAPKEPGYTGRYGRLLHIWFKPEVTEAERTALYEKYKLRYVAPYDVAVTVDVRDDFDLNQVYEAIKKEPTVKTVSYSLLGPG